MSPVFESVINSEDLTFLSNAHRVCNCSNIPLFSFSPFLHSQIKIFPKGIKKIIGQIQILQFFTKFFNVSFNTISQKKKRDYQRLGIKITE